jgi:hypothetical protein
VLQESVKAMSLILDRNCKIRATQGELTRLDRELSSARNVANSAAHSRQATERYNRRGYLIYTSEYVNAKSYEDECDARVSYLVQQIQALEKPPQD